MNFALNKRPDDPSKSTRRAERIAAYRRRPVTQIALASIVGLLCGLFVVAIIVVR